MATSELVPVTRSSTIEAVGYDDEAFILTIRFKGGATYQYTNIGPWMHKKLMEAPSIGTWFAQNIKSDPVKFPCTKLDTPKKPQPIGEWVHVEDRIAGLERKIAELTETLAFHMSNGHGGDV